MLLVKLKIGALLCGEQAFVYIFLSAFFLLNSAVCEEYFLAREIFLFFDTSLRLIEPLGFTYTKSKLSGKNGIGFHCHLCCGVLGVFFLASILWLAARSARYSRSSSIHCIFPLFLLYKVGSFCVHSDEANQT